MTVKPKYWVLSLFVLLGGIDPSNATSTPVDPKVIHIVNRLSFGPRPGDMQRVESMGVERYIQEQLSPNSISEPPSLTSQISQLETLRLNPVELLAYGKAPSPEQKPSPEQIKVADRHARQVLNEAIQARLLRATSSSRQLQEVMADFWFNHFNVDAGKGHNGLWVGAYEQEAIRPYVLGRFRDLLGATAHHPAMLYYLDNFRNSAASRPDARGKIQGLNENYARELMELHTLGVDAGYTQQDVIALARILSGWGLSRPEQETKNGSGFYFNPKHHDFSDKVFLGHTIKGSGEAEGEQALDILARSPATARHISYKLAEYFVSDRPPSALINQLAQRYLATDGNIREVLNTLFHSREFWDTKNFNAKFKTPYQYAISVVRATNINVKHVRPISIIDFLKQLAMPLYRCQTPNGYKNTEDAWLNPDAITRRLSFAIAIATANLPPSGSPTKVDAKKMTPTQQRPPIVTVDARQLSNTLGNSFSATTQNAIASSSPQIRTALILGSPEFMRR
ncbi:MAG: DUF1800 domain-containing protein [Komarekiella atlantica HA4396-MV6]|nr:DUF1800 domain-containing protein [Komarekiella atlantica HA4396-MV6]